MKYTDIKNIKDTLNRHFDEIEEIEIEIIDKDSPTLYIDGVPHKIYNESRVMPIILPEGMIKLHEIREDVEWIEIENLYNKVMLKCYNDGISHDKIKFHMSQYVSDANGNYIPDMDNGVFNICNNYPEFEIIDKKLYNLYAKIKCKISLTYIDYINSLKKYSDIKIEWKNEETIKTKVYYFCLTNGCPTIIFSKLIQESRLFYNKLIKNQYNQIIFNKDINSEVYNLYLEVKKEKEDEKINTDTINTNNTNNTNNFEEIKKLLENTKLTQEQKLTLLKLLI